MFFKGGSFKCLHKCLFDAVELFQRGLKVLEISRASTSGAGKFSESSKLSSLSQKVSRLVLSRWMSSSRGFRRRCSNWTGCWRCIAECAPDRVHCARCARGNCVDTGNFLGHFDCTIASRRIYTCELLNRRISNDNDPMHMIGHHDKFVQFDVCEMVRKFIPIIMRRSTNGRPLHCAIYNVAKQALAVARDNGDEIRALLRIIVTAKADRVTMPFKGVAFHYYFSTHPTSARVSAMRLAQSLPSDSIRWQPCALYPREPTKVPSSSVQHRPEVSVRPRLEHLIYLNNRMDFLDSR